ncbi:MAG TPA: 3-dehydroquinate synthase, partial [Allosphingosinicella sp.]
MTTLPVALGERSYDIVIEEGLLGRATDHLAPFARDGRLIVISDENVWAAQGLRLVAGLGSLKAEPIILP